jgi:hypothetical protein
MKRVRKDLKLAAKPKPNRPPVQKSLATDFRSWIGIAAKGPMNPNPRFTNEDQLWEKDGD